MKIKKRYFRNIFLLLLLLLSIGIFISQDTTKTSQSESMNYGNDLGFDKKEDVIVENARNIISHPSGDENKKGILVDEGGKVSYNHQGEFRTYENLGKGSKFYFQDKELVSAELKVTKDSEYEIANVRFKAPEGSRVVFEDGKVSVIIPKTDVITDSKTPETSDTTTKIEEPSLIDNKEPRTEIKYLVEEGNEQGVSIVSEGRENSVRGVVKDNERQKVELGFDFENKGFFLNGQGEINNLRIGRIESKNEAKKTFLFFDGKEHSINSPYISFGENELFISSVKGTDSSDVWFLKGNKYVDIDENKETLALQAVDGGSLKLTRREGYFPLITAKGKHVAILGDKYLDFDKDYKAKHNMKLDGQPLPSGMPQLQIKTFFDDGKGILNEDLFSDKNKIFTAKEVKSRDGLLYATRNGEIVSPRISINELSEENKNILRELSKEKFSDVMQRVARGEDFGKALSFISTQTKEQQIGLPIPDYSKYFGSETGARTKNFRVNSPKGNARAYALALEYWRKQHALEWFGKELPDWGKPFPVTIASGNIGAGGATTFSPLGRGRGIGIGSMDIQGSRERLLDSIIPHEVLHTVLASNFGEAIPRWADEGVCTTVECSIERNKMNRLLINSLQTERGIPFGQMLPMMDYPADILPLYAQGASATEFLLRKGGDGIQGKRKFIEFLDDSMSGGSTTEAWTRALQKHYGINSIGNFQNQWLQDLKQRISTRRIFNNFLIIIKVSYIRFISINKENYKNDKILITK